ncbi:dihydrodipicolinate synthase family protein [Flavilitoribacter nigricans]|uniref:Dihydrodipicolinate synthetase n=1 Tax=Flavilitoribacter nigricans (strain ATCC 23147 / DSM 23189 / NBRC 102662 / NCIMB 1420 / SS-2) TaxID=1122177 RepID=A0A2D0N9A6_FLAN2|nr:dihydrodipicolinate synthase family protein [Flavilitoribacter nigricans]PHN04956.1 dihydrodipicolinate synthetase [Flavilitoribacter nigricans DSM 23189 = NBRC 102662]
MEKLTGLIAAPFTPFDEKGALATDRVADLAALYGQNGVRGAFIAGSTGECASLSLAEKEALMFAWADTKAVNPDLKLLYLLGGTCLQDIQHLAGKAAELKLDGISLVAPYYFRPSSVETLVDFCQEAAAAAPDLPFYYYHIPSLSGGFYSMTRFLELAAPKIPNLAGIKYSHSDIMEFQACLAFQNEKFDLLWGTDEALLSGMVAGAKGAVGSTYNYAAPLYHRIIRAFNEGDLEEARRLQLLSVRIVELLVKYGGIGAGKAFMKLIGVDCGWSRPPVGHPKSADLDKLRSELEALGFFDFCNRYETLQSK